MQYFNQYHNLGSKNETHPRLVELTKTILRSLGKLPIDKEIYEQEDKDAREYAITKKVMSHICILEANHIPGLSLANGSKKSKDDLIRDWAKKTTMILAELINFYKPDILIGGNTIGHFYNIPRCRVDLLKDSIENGNNELLSKLGINVYHDCVEQPKGSSSFVFKASLGRDNEPIYVIDAYHPTKYKDAEAETDAKLIKEWMSKENGITKSPMV